MAIATKLETVAQSCKDIREALNAQNSKLGDGSISALGDEIKNCPKMAIVYKEGDQPVKSKIVFGDGEGNLPNMSALNDNVPHTIVSAIVPKCNASPSFSQQKSLENLYFEDGTTSLGSCEGCTSLKSVYLPEGLTRLDYITFKSCNSIPDIYLPTTLTSAGMQNCDVTNVHIKDLNKWLAVNNASYSFFQSANEHHLILNGEEVTEIVIPDTITDIPVNKFAGLVNLTGTINIPSSVTSINNGAFSNCQGLTKIVIPNSITNLGNTAVSGLRNLEKVICKAPLIGQNLMQKFTGAGSGSKRSLIEFYNEGNPIALSLNGMGNFSNYIIHGDVVGGTRAINPWNKIIIDGNLTANTATCAIWWARNYSRYFELGGTYSTEYNTNNLFYYATNQINDPIIMHFKYEGVAGKPKYVRFDVHPNTKIYVGDGSSQEHDNAILQQYLADEDWAQYSDKLDIWYNYHGLYKSEEYDQLDYVSTDSSAYADTGISGDNDNLKIKIQFSVENHVAWKGWVGNHNHNNNKSWRIRWNDKNDDTFCVQLNCNSNAAGNTILNGLTKSRIHTIELTKTKCILDSVTNDITKTATGNANSNNILLGRDSTADAPADLGLKIYDFSLYDGSTLLCDYTPCLRKSDNAVGFWDHVSQTFIQSITESPFIAGPSILN